MQATGEEQLEGTFTNPAMTRLNEQESLTFDVLGLLKTATDVVKSLAAEHNWAVRAPARPLFCALWAKSMCRQCCLPYLFSTSKSIFRPFQKQHW